MSNYHDLPAETEQVAYRTLVSRMTTCVALMALCAILLWAVAHRGGTV